MTFEQVIGKHFWYRQPLMSNEWYIDAFNIPGQFISFTKESPIYELVENNLLEAALSPINCVRILAEQIIKDRRNDR